MASCEPVAAAHHQHHQLRPIGRSSTSSSLAAASSLATKADWTRRANNNNNLSGAQKRPSFRAKTPGPPSSTTTTTTTTTLANKSYHPAELTRAQSVDAADTAAAAMASPQTLQDLYRNNSNKATSGQLTLNFDENEQQQQLQQQQRGQQQQQQQHVGPVMGIFFKVWSLVKVTKVRHQHKARIEAEQQAAAARCVDSSATSGAELSGRIAAGSACQANDVHHQHQQHHHRQWAPSLPPLGGANGEMFRRAGSQPAERRLQVSPSLALASAATTMTTSSSSGVSSSSCAGSLAAGAINSTTTHQLANNHFAANQQQRPAQSEAKQVVVANNNKLVDLKQNKRKHQEQQQRSAVALRARRVSAGSAALPLQNLIEQNVTKTTNNYQHQVGRTRRIGSFEETNKQQLRNNSNTQLDDSDANEFYSTPNDSVQSVSGHSSSIIVMSNNNNNNNNDYFFQEQSLSKQTNSINQHSSIVKSFSTNNFQSAQQFKLTGSARPFNQSKQKNSPPPLIPINPHHQQQQVETSSAPTNNSSHFFISSSSSSEESTNNNTTSAQQVLNNNNNKKRSNNFKSNNLTDTPTIKTKTLSQTTNSTSCETAKSRLSSSRARLVLGLGAHQHVGAGGGYDDDDNDDDDEEEEEDEEHYKLARPLRQMMSAGQYKRSPSLHEMKPINYRQYHEPAYANQYEFYSNNITKSHQQQQQQQQSTRQRQPLVVPNSISLHECLGATKTITTNNNNRLLEAASNGCCWPAAAPASLHLEAELMHSSTTTADQGVDEEKSPSASWSMSMLNLYDNQQQQQQHQEDEYKLAQMLLRCGSNPSACDEQGNNALMHAIKADNLPVLKCLLDQQQQQHQSLHPTSSDQQQQQQQSSLIEQLNEAQLSPLDLICSKRPNELRVEILKTLIEASADLDRPNPRDNTRLLDRLISEHNEPSQTKTKTTTTTDKMAYIDCLLHYGAKIGSTTWLAAQGKFEIQLRLLRKLIQDGYFLYRKSSLNEAHYRFEYALKRLAEFEFQLASIQSRLKLMKTNNAKSIDLIQNQLMSWSKAGQQIKYKTYLGLSKCELLLSS